jgi:HlyD family secretion protein
VAKTRTASVHRGIRTLYSVGTIRDLGDGQLLERFATDRGEAAELAFAALVERHGPMVLRVCHSVLSNWHDTEDAFQATFLLLVKKARGLWVRDSLGPWLHQVAVRTAWATRVAAARRRRCEERMAVVVAAAAPPPSDDDTNQILHLELNRLPERFRLPLILCDLEECSHQQAARHLGWPIGTVKSRLARGRERLRERLTSRGFTANLAPMFATARCDASLASRMPALIDSTARAALPFASSSTVAVGSLATLAHEVIRTVLLSRWMKAATIVVAVGATSAGVGFLAGKREQQPRNQQQAPAASQKAADHFPKGTITKLELEGTDVPRENVIPKLSSRVGEPLSREKLEGDLKALLSSNWFSSASYWIGETPPKSAHYTVVFALRDWPHHTAVHPANLHAVVSQPGMVVRQNSSYAICEVEGESVIQRILPEGSIVKKGDLICELDSETISTQLIQQKERVDTAEVILKAATATREQAEAALREYTAATTTPSQTVLAALRAHVEDQRASEMIQKGAWAAEHSAARRLERQAENRKVRAPANGIIVYANEPNGPRIHIANGATVRERQIIVKIPDDKSPLRVASHVPRWSLPRLRVGSTVQIHTGDGADRDRIVSGKITEIADWPDPSGRSYSGPPLHAIKVSIDDAPRDFVPGKMVRIEIDVAQLTGVLTIPADAVVFFQGKDRVAVKKTAGGFEWREVTLGLSDGVMVEVKEGLRTRDVVIRRAAKLVGEADQATPKKPQRAAN